MKKTNYRQLQYPLLNQLQNKMLVINSPAAVIRKDHSHTLKLGHSYGGTLQRRELSWLRGGGW